MRSARHLLTALAATSLAAAASAAAPAAGSDTRALMVEHKCYICHADGYPMAGPAFVDVASAYRHDPHAVDYIAAIIRRGQHGSSPWRMPPHPELTRSQARRIAAYILAMRVQASAQP